MESTPKRRWLRFSLRTCFVLVTLFCCWLGYQLNWIRQRHEVLASDRVEVGRYFGKLQTPDQSLWILRLFREPRYFEVYLNCPKVKASEEETLEVKRMQRIFPEAIVGWKLHTAGGAGAMLLPYIPENVP